MGPPQWPSAPADRLARIPGTIDVLEKVLAVRPNKAEGLFHNFKKLCGLRRIVPLRLHSLNPGDLFGNPLFGFCNAAVHEVEGFALWGQVVRQAALPRPAGVYGARIAGDACQRLDWVSVQKGPRVRIIRH